MKGLQNYPQQLCYHKIDNKDQQQVLQDNANLDGLTIHNLFTDFVPPASTVGIKPIVVGAWLVLLFGEHR